MRYRSLDERARNWKRRAHRKTDSHFAPSAGNVLRVAELKRCFSKTTSLSGQKRIWLIFGSLLPLRAQTVVNIAQTGFATARNARFAAAFKSACMGITVPFPFPFRFGAGAGCGTCFAVINIGPPGCRARRSTVWIVHSVRLLNSSKISWCARATAQCRSKASGLALRCAALVISTLIPAG